MTIAALYEELVPWYRLLDPLEDHRDEAEIFRAAFESAIVGRRGSLLELGAGAGNQAFFMKQEYRCTLTDLAPRMLDLSRAINPECEHLLGDMRTLRLGTEFDAVVVHDAVVYMTTPEQLRAAAETAFLHTRPGGAAIFAPDCVRETFVERPALHEHADGPRHLACIEWSWDPDPTDQTYTVDYAFLLRDGATMTTAHDRHVEGLFPRATWISVLGAAGYEVELLRRPIGVNELDDVFLCRRP